MHSKAMQEEEKEKIFIKLVLSNRVFFFYFLSTTKLIQAVVLLYVNIGRKKICNRKINKMK
jgi:hypothetical protein